jgi:protein ImuA
VSASSQRHLIDELRERIRRIERRPARRDGFLPSGRPEVDALLPGGGFPKGALAHLAGGPASGKTLLALSALARAAAEGGLAAFVDGRGELYPPAAEAVGLDLGRLLVVRPGGAPSGAARGGPARGGPERGAGRGEEALAGLWAAEALLGSGAFAAVAVDVPLRGLAPARAEAMLRRLAAAAEKGGAVGLWLGAPAPGCRVPAAVRLELPSPATASAGSGCPLPEGEGCCRLFPLGVRKGSAGDGRAA